MELSIYTGDAVQSMSRIILFNKPFGVLCQFTDTRNRVTLASFINDKGFYPAGRLDRDSEGLLILTDNGKLQQKISDPAFKAGKTYWAQVEGTIDSRAIGQLRRGVVLKDGKTRPARAHTIAPPEVWQREPPVRRRLTVPTSWVELTLFEGRNRQVRRMTAAVGYPTLRLIRCRVEPWDLSGLQPGESRKLDDVVF